MSANPVGVDLAACYAAILDAREECRQARAEPEQRRWLIEAQQRHCRALEAYAAASAALGLVMPRRLHLELVLYRSLAANPR